MADDPFQIDADRAAGDASAGAQGPSAARFDGGEGRGAINLRDLLGGNWLLAALVAAGGLCLWAMSLMRGPAPASAQQIEVQSSVDDALAKLTGPMDATVGKTTAALVETFNCEARQRQIPPAALRGNPFVFHGQAPAPTEAPALEPKTAPAPPDTREADALAAAKTLRLQSVLMGRANAALINDNLLTEGQVIRGWTVTKIEPREVRLAWKDKNYVLKMPE